MCKGVAHEISIKSKTKSSSMLQKEAGHEGCACKRVTEIMPYLKTQEYNHPKFHSHK